MESTNVPELGIQKTHAMYVTALLKLPIETHDFLRAIIDECNNKKMFGRKVTLKDLLVFYATVRFKDNDIEEIRRLTYTAKDKLLFAHYKYNEESQNPISYDDWMFMICEKLQNISLQEPVAH